jgi:hypothetical protein
MRCGRRLRGQGLDYEQIATALGVAKSSVSLWVRDLPRFFLRFLAETATAPEDLAFRVYIHENADARSAELFWLEITGAKPEQFHWPALKRHNPKTERQNVGESYHGCLRIEVNRSSGLYRRIEGLAEAIMSGD